MKTKGEIAVAAVGLGLLARDSKEEKVRVIAGKYMDLLLWVLDYPNEFKPVYKQILDLGLDEEEAIRKMDEALTISEDVIGKLKSLFGEKPKQESKPEPEDGTITE